MLAVSIAKGIMGCPRSTREPKELVESDTRPKHQKDLTRPVHQPNITSASFLNSSWPYLRSSLIGKPTCKHHWRVQVFSCFLDGLELCHADMSIEPLEEWALLSFGEELLQTLVRWKSV
jgi:hypothetical protein